METSVREKAERVARHAGMTGADAIWAKADGAEGELCLVAKRIDGAWRGFVVCENFEWGPIEAHDRYTYAQFERAMIRVADEVTREMKVTGLWAENRALPLG